MVHRCLFIPNIKLIAVSAPLSQSGLALFRKIGVARKTCIICHLPTVITYKYSSHQWTELSQTDFLLYNLWKFSSLHFTRKPNKSFTLFISCRCFPGPLFKGLLRQQQILLSAQHCMEQFTSPAVGLKVKLFRWKICKYISSCPYLGLGEGLLSSSC